MRNAQEQLARALAETWRQPAVGLKSGFGCAPAPISEGNLRGVGYTDLQLGVSYLDERWLTPEMATRSSLPDELRSAAEAQRHVLFFDGERHEVDARPLALPQPTRPHAARHQSDPWWTLDKLHGLEVDADSPAVEGDPDIIGRFSTTGIGRLVRRVWDGRSDSTAQVWLDSAGRVLRVSLGVQRQTTWDWWIAEFQPYGTLHEVLDWYQHHPNTPSGRLHDAHEALDDRGELGQAFGVGP
jgi:hypothetical protein